MRDVQSILAILSIIVFAFAAYITCVLVLNCFHLSLPMCF